MGGEEAANCSNLLIREESVNTNKSCSTIRYIYPDVFKILVDPRSQMLNFAPAARNQNILHAAEIHHRGNCFTPESKIKLLSFIIRWLFCVNIDPDLANMYKDVSDNTHMCSF